MQTLPVSSALYQPQGCTVVDLRTLHVLAAVFQEVYTREEGLHGGCRAGAAACSRGTAGSDCMEVVVPLKHIEIVNLSWKCLYGV